MEVPCVVGQVMRLSPGAMIGFRPLAMYNVFSSLTNRRLSGLASHSVSLNSPGIVPERDAKGCEGAIWALVSHCEGGADW